MKCIHCGNNLNIDDEFCNSCGNENVHATTQEGYATL